MIDNSNNFSTIENNPYSKKHGNNHTHLSPAPIIAHHKGLKTVVIDEQTALDDLSLSITKSIDAASTTPTAAHKLLRGAMFQAGTIAAANPSGYQALIDRIESAAQTLGVDIHQPTTLQY